MPTIHGTAPNGAPFTLRRDDKYYSEYDATFESLFELLYELTFLQENHFGHMSFSSVLTDSQVTVAKDFDAPLPRLLGVGGSDRRINDRLEAVLEALGQHEPTRRRQHSETAKHQNPVLRLPELEHPPEDHADKRRARAG